MFETRAPAGVTFDALNRGARWWRLPLVPSSGAAGRDPIPFDYGMYPEKRERLAEVTFPAVGSYELVTTATADDFVDEDDEDGVTTKPFVPEAPDVRTIVVTEENADLVAGTYRWERGLRIGFPPDRPTHVPERRPHPGRLRHGGGQPPAGHHPRAGHLPLLGHGDYMEGSCTVSATGYACGPFHEDLFTWRRDYEHPDYIGWSLPYSRWVEYDVIVPAGAEPVEATATIVGRNDPDLTNNTSVVTVQPPASSPLDVEVTGPTFTGADDGGPATITAEVTCTAPSSVTTEFTLEQPGPTGDPHTATSTVTAPCTPGAPNRITSDYLEGFTPGAATVTAIAQSGTDYAGDSGPVTVAPFSTVRDQLLARLADPNDTTAATEFIAALVWRVQYNPLFARAFYIAILNG